MTPEDAVLKLAAAFTDAAPDYPAGLPAEAYLLDWATGTTKSGAARADVLATPDGEAALESLVEVILETGFAAVMGLQAMASRVSNPAEGLSPAVLGGIRVVLNLSSTALCD